MWFLLALIAGIFFAVNSLLIRSYSKKNQDSLIFSFLWSSIGSLILLPLALLNTSFPTETIFWGGILLVSSLIVINNALLFSASKYVSASTQKVIEKLKLIGILIAGIIIFNDIISITNAIGLILIIMASFLIIDYKNWHSTKRSIIYLIISAIIGVIITIIIKQLTKTSEYIDITFLIFFIPAIINSITIPNFVNRLKSKIANIKPIILISFFGVIANLALIKAMSYDNLSGVYFVIEGSLIIVVFGEHLFLKERERLGWKIAAVILAVIGTILLQI